jgi:peptidoglycan/LPS O-acetylase OafA/YrhL
MKAPLTLTREENKLQYIDCLRGIAIIMVILNHADWHLPKMNDYAQAISNYGQMGVQLFFVVSAFTLCLSLNRRRVDDGENLKTFYLRRYFRIAPLYYIGIPLYLCYHSFLEPYIEGRSLGIADWYNVPNILANLLLINDFIPGDANNRVVPGGWSIGTETTFYAIFPFIFLLYKKYKDNNVALALIPVVGLLLGITAIRSMEFMATEIVDYNNFSYFRDNGKFLYFNLLCQLPVFLMGMSLFFIVQKVRKATTLDKYLLLLCFLSFTFFALIMFVFFDRLIVLLAFLPAVSFFFLFLMFKEIPFLSNKLLARIGQLSFSIYLFHFVIAFEGSRFLNLWLQPYMATEVIFFINSVLTLILTAGVALLSEKYIEKPGIELGKKLIKNVKAKQKSKAPHLAMDGVN